MKKQSKRENELSNSNHTLKTMCYFLISENVPAKRAEKRGNYLL